MNPVLLITSSVYVSAPIVKVCDPKVRIDLTLKALRNWILIKNNLKIVLCDGSGYDFSDDVLKMFPNTEIECLFFTNNKKKVGLYGKGYGEGEIIEFALLHSKLLQSSTSFAKCTSKLWVPNYIEVLGLWNNVCQFNLVLNNLFTIFNIKFIAVDTRFFIVNKKVYRNYFRHTYKSVRDMQGFFLEHAFRYALLKKSSNISTFMFPSRVIILGVSGSSGLSYPFIKSNLYNRSKYFIKALLVRLNRF